MITKEEAKWSSKNDEVTASYCRPMTAMRFAAQGPVPRSRSKVRMTRKQSLPNRSLATWYRKSGYSPRHSRSSPSGRQLNSWKSSRSKPGGGEAREPPAHPAPEPAQPSAVTRWSRDHRLCPPHVVKDLLTHEHDTIYFTNVPYVITYNVSWGRIVVNWIANSFYTLPYQY